MGFGRAAMQHPSSFGPTTVSSTLPAVFILQLRKHEIKLCSPNGISFNLAPNIVGIISATDKVKELQPQLRQFYYIIHEQLADATVSCKNQTKQ